MMNECLLGFYSSLYKCEDCRELRDPGGVYYFIRGKGKPHSPKYLPPTIPVSHFGDITNSRLWVVTTNPKGDRNDPLVGLNVHNFGANSRAHLKESDIKSVFEIQCSYFRESNGKHHIFFTNLVKLLDGIRLGPQSLSFRSGDMCFVDAIKCPTRTSWTGFVMTGEGKQVWNNCLRVKNRFLPRQLEIYKPKIVMYYGTKSLIKVCQKGNKVGESGTYSNGLKLETRHLFSEGRLERISIEFSKARRALDLPEPELRSIRNYINRSIDSLEVLRIPRACV